MKFFAAKIFSNTQCIMPHIRILVEDICLIQFIYCASILQTFLSGPIQFQNTYLCTYFITNAFRLKSQLYPSAYQFGFLIICRRNRHTFLPLQLKIISTFNQALTTFRKRLFIKQKSKDTKGDKTFYFLVHFSLAIEKKKHIQKKTKLQFTNVG